MRESQSDTNDQEPTPSENLAYIVERLGIVAIVGIGLIVAVILLAR